MRFLPLLLFVFPLLSACAEQGDLTPKLWSLPVGGYGVSTLEDDLLVGYLSVTTEQIAAVDVAERKVLWRSEEAELATFSPNAVVSDQITYVFLAGKGLLIYNRAGKLLSKTPPPGSDEAEGGFFGAGPRLFGSRLVVPNSRYLYAYDVSSLSAPKLLWRLEFPSAITALTTDNQGIYVGGVATALEGSLVKLNLGTGKSMWRTDPERVEQSFSSVQVLRLTENTLLAYVEEILQAFDRNTGQLLWATPLTGCPEKSGGARALEVGGGMAFLSPSFGSCIFGFDLTTGVQRWAVATGEVGPDGAISIGGKPLYHNGVVYTSVERLWALDAETGKVLSFASQPAHNTTDTSVHYYDGEILVWGDDLTAYKPAR